VIRSDDNKINIVNPHDGILKDSWQVTQFLLVLLPNGNLPSG